MALKGDSRNIVGVKRNYAPSAFDIIFVMVAPITAIFGAVRLAQNDGDLAAHLRMGQVILDTGRIPERSLASYTAASETLVAHGWLSEVIFAALFRVGGLALLAVFTGIVIGATHGAIAVFLRKRGCDPRWAFGAALVSLLLAATHWQTRPHMFSIVGATLTLFLLESNHKYREFLFIPLFGVWANLHGGWAYGLTMIGAYIFGTLIEAWLSPGERARSLRQAGRHVLAFAMAAAATLLTPYGFSLHREVFSAVTNASLSNNIIEYLSPNFHDAGQLPFLLAILLVVALFAITTKPSRPTWLTLILMSLFFALRSARNVALFGVSAWPLVALHAARAWPAGRRSFRFFGEVARLDPNTRIGIYALPTAALLLGLGLNRGHVGSMTLISDRFSPRSFPTLAVEKATAAHLSGRVYDPWEWAGYIMYAWPSARLHVDPLKFNTITMRSYARIEDMRPGWQDELERWNVQTVIVRTSSPLAKGLSREQRWTTWHRDTLATVFRHAGSSSTPSLPGN